jgi:hypothetical protein
VCAFTRVVLPETPTLLTSATGKKYPRLQLLTIEGLLSGKQRAEHPDHQPDLNFKKAKAESNAAQKSLI